VDAAESAAWDAATIGGGTPSRALMQRAGASAAAELTREFAGRLSRGVAVFAGPGNNGGDAWVVARALAAVGVRVRVAVVGEPKTPDAQAEREMARAVLTADAPSGAEEVVVDGVLGTGATGRPRGAAAEAITRMRALRSGGASVVALDVPSGVDASTGAAEHAVVADLTVTFGAMKRGLLVARALCGRIVVVDIGLDTAPADVANVPRLADHGWVARHIPPIAADAHKGTRRRLAIVGGGIGMVGAALLAARSAMRSGVGMVRLVVDANNLAAAQTTAYEALARGWPSSDDEARETISDWAHAVVLGPGLGRSDETRALAERVLRAWRGAVVLDADALNVFEGDATALAALLGARRAILTPHVAEFGRLAGISADEVLATRFTAGLGLAKTLRAAVLLKGVPTVIAGSDGRRIVTAAGTPALAAGGSGDILAGIAGTLLGQMDDPVAAAACAAWAHGHAAELGGAGSALRGVSLDDVIAALPRVWSEPVLAPRAPVLAELPAVGDDDRGMSAATAAPSA
jgi:NAD(P)H-hydrate epimerase